MKEIDLLFSEPGTKYREHRHKDLFYVPLIMFHVYLTQTELKRSQEAMFY